MWECQSRTSVVFRITSLIHPLQSVTSHLLWGTCMHARTCTNTQALDMCASSLFFRGILLGSCYDSIHSFVTLMQASLSVLNVQVNSFGWCFLSVCLYVFFEWKWFLISSSTCTPISFHGKTSNNFSVPLCIHHVIYQFGVTGVRRCSRWPWHSATFSLCHTHNAVDFPMALMAANEGFTSL